MHHVNAKTLPIHLDKEEIIVPRMTLAASLLNRTTQEPTARKTIEITITRTQAMSTDCNLRYMESGLVANNKRSHPSLVAIVSEEGMA